ncbi:MAG: site-2 protease family protein, partial [Thermoplasmatales archaeon]
RNPIREGKIAIAGPSANLVIGVILLPVLLFAHLGSLARVDIYYLTYINIWLGFFNLIPIPPLDGSKVFAWDRRNWAVIFAIAAALVVYFFLFL